MAVLAGCSDGGKKSSPAPVKPPVVEPQFATGLHYRQYGEENTLTTEVQLFSTSGKSVVANLTTDFSRDNRGFTRLNNVSYASRDVEIQPFQNTPDFSKGVPSTLFKFNNGLESNRANATMAVRNSSNSDNPPFDLYVNQMVHYPHVDAHEARGGGYRVTAREFLPEKFAGSWERNGANGGTDYMTIEANGSFRIDYDNGCTVNGTALRSLKVEVTDAEFTVSNCNDLDGQYQSLLGNLDGRAIVFASASQDSGFHQVGVFEFNK